MSEQKTLVKDLEYWRNNAEEDYMKVPISVLRYISELEKSIKNLPISTVMEWVGVEEDSPNEHEDVLVYYYSNKKSKSFPNLQFMKESSFYDGKFECKEEVTHWAKLPNPPVT